MRGLFLMQWLWGAPGTKEPVMCVPRTFHGFCSDLVFLPTEEFQALLKRLPSDRFLNSTAISQYWAMDTNVQHRYQQLGASLKVLLKKMHRIVRRLFNLCKRCHRQPRFRLPKERWVPGLQIQSTAPPAILPKPEKMLWSAWKNRTWWHIQPFWSCGLGFPTLSYSIIHCVWRS